MQITETLAEPLRREFTIVVDVKDLDERLTGRVTEMQPQDSSEGLPPGQGAGLLPEEGLSASR